MGKGDPPDPTNLMAVAWGKGPPRRGPATGGPSYSSIASINTSVRDNKKILEIRLEKQEEASFNLSVPEIEQLLRRLNIDSSHFLAVSEGKPVVLVTLHDRTQR